MPDIVVDTHILIWLYTDPSRISRKALAAVREAETNLTIHISAISIVELIYLTERQRIDGEVLESVYKTLEDSERLIALSNYRMALQRKSLRFPESKYLKCQIG